MRRFLFFIILVILTCNGKAQCKQDTILLKDIHKDGMEILDNARKELVGKTLYTRTALWMMHHPERKNSNLEFTDEYETTCRYCPVTITRVEHDYQKTYLVYFKKKDQNEEYCFMVEFDPERIHSFRSLIKMLTLKNPYDDYPGISKKRWSQIMNQRVIRGFSKQEVIVAYGEPDEKYFENENEEWLYHNYCKKQIAVSFKKDKVKNIIIRIQRH